MTQFIDNGHLIKHKKTVYGFSRSYLKNTTDLITLVLDYFSAKIFISDFKLKKLATIDTKSSNSYSPGYSFQRCGFEPNSNLLTLTMSEGGTIYDNVALTVINIKTKEMLLHINAINCNDNDSAQWIKYKNKMCLVYSNHAKGGKKLNIWDPTTRKEIHSVQINDTMKKFYINSQNNAFILCRSGKLYIGHINQNEIKEFVSVDYTASGHCIAVTDNGKYAIS
eukprot:292944_1